ncbi:MAG: maleylpyruvate isomerase N-terminal domain-containing protein [Sporichthyaceae bacterium]
MDQHPLGTARADFEELRAAVGAVAARVCALLRSGLDPTRPALGTWNLADVAAHLSHAWEGIPGMAARDLEGAKARVPDAGVPIGRPSGHMLDTIDELAPMTVGLVANDPERDLERIADHIEAAAKKFCGEFDPFDPPGRRPWMIAPIYGEADLFGGHILNETLVHGYDLAAAAGVPWSMSEHEAALVFRGFLLQVMCWVTELVPAGPEMRIDLRLAGDRRLLLHNTPAGMKVSEPVGRVPADARMWIRPTAMTLLAWRRRSLASVVRGADMVVWGRKPWMANKLLDLAPKV